jgi:hypothetical protein
MNPHGGSLHHPKKFIAFFFLGGGDYGVLAKATIGRFYVLAKGTQVG